MLSQSIAMAHLCCVGPAHLLNQMPADVLAEVCSRSHLQVTCGAMLNKVNSMPSLFTCTAAHGWQELAQTAGMQVVRCLPA